MEIWAVVVAGGSGSRFGRPKQLCRLGDRRVIDHAVAAVAPHVAGVVVVGSAQLGTADELGVDARVDGGPSRSASVRSGLAALPDGATHVLIHDAARPLATAGVVARVVDALVGGAAAVVPVVPVTDTLRSVGGGMGATGPTGGMGATGPTGGMGATGPTGGTVDRSGLVAVQTPQGFERHALMAAHAGGSEATDDAGLLERAGHPVVHVEGSPINLKITFPHDLVVAEALLQWLERDAED